MSHKIYFGEFAGNGYPNEGKASTWARVQDEFQTDFPEPDQVIFARYTAEGYEGDALVVFRNGDQIGMATGGHCSCTGLEGQWEPEYASLETTAEMLKRGWNISKTEQDLVLSRLSGEK